MYGPHDSPSEATDQVASGETTPVEAFKPIDVEPGPLIHAAACHRNATTLSKKPWPEGGDEDESSAQELQDPLDGVNAPADGSDQEGGVGNGLENGISEESGDNPEEQRHDDKEAPDRDDESEASAEQPQPRAVSDDGSDPVDDAEPEDETSAVDDGCEKGDEPNATDGVSDADLDLMAEELLSCVPEEVREFFTVADALAGVADAEEGKAFDALVDVALSVIVDALFHSIHMGMMAPVVKWISKAFDTSETTAAQLTVNFGTDVAHVQVRRNNDDILLRERANLSARKARRKALDHVTEVRFAEITIYRKKIIVRTSDYTGRIDAKAADILRPPVGQEIDEQDRSWTPAAPIWRQLSPQEASAEGALLRTLRDIHDGRLSLWVQVLYVDLNTGRPLDPPKVLEVRPDRLPYPGVPDPRGKWWRALIGRGWLELPAPDTFPKRYLVSDAGKEALESAP